MEKTVCPRAAPEVCNPFTPWGAGQTVDQITGAVDELGGASSCGRTRHVIEPSNHIPYTTLPLDFLHALPDGLDGAAIAQSEALRPQDVTEV